MKQTKRIKELSEKIDVTKEYNLVDAVNLLKVNSKVKFVESLDCAVKLGVDPRHADQMVRGTVSLPNMEPVKRLKFLLLPRELKAKKPLKQVPIMLALRNILKKLNLAGQMLM